VTTAPGVLDLRPFACPLTYVKTRIALERLADGELLEILLADGEPVESVPRSAAEEGHVVVSVATLGEAPGAGWRVVLRKRTAPHAELP
jgi:TusA-related sulfurtransferase